jgi:hypothetical protein
MNWSKNVLPPDRKSASVFISLDARKPSEGFRLMTYFYLSVIMSR